MIQAREEAWEAVVKRRRLEPGYILECQCDFLMD